MLNFMPNTVENVCKVIGETPMIKLNQITTEHGIKCQVFAKAEFLNIGGSIKDRIALYMIESAEKKGLIRPGYTLVEETSGNTGISLAIIAIVKGYKLVAVCHDRVSEEKKSILRHLGANVIIASSGLNTNDPESSRLIATKISQKPRHYLVDQHNNKDNFLAHYVSTAKEIYEQMEGKINYLFCAAGT
jgi:cystathionine beta-synthase